MGLLGIFRGGSAVDTHTHTYVHTYVHTMLFTIAASAVGVVLVLLLLAGATAPLWYRGPQ